MIPTAKTRPNQKRERRDAIYKLYVDLTKEVKQVTRDLPEEALEQLVAAQMQLLVPPEDAAETTPVDTQTLRQLALFASQAVVRQLYERYRK